jgi:hypothetical protein
VGVGMKWKKSSYCDSNGCVEVGSDWIKSSLCGPGECVEVSRPDACTIYVRDSKNPDGANLQFDANEWLAFVAGVKAGEFDL